MRLTAASTVDMYAEGTADLVEWEKMAILASRDWSTWLRSDGILSFCCGKCMRK